MTPIQVSRVIRKWARGQGMHVESSGNGMMLELSGGGWYASIVVDVQPLPDSGDFFYMGQSVWFASLLQNGIAVRAIPAGTPGFDGIQADYHGVTLCIYASRAGGAK